MEHNLDRQARVISKDNSCTFSTDEAMQWRYIYEYLPTWANRAGRFAFTWRSTFPSRLRTCRRIGRFHILRGAQQIRSPPPAPLPAETNMRKCSRIYGSQSTATAKRGINQLELMIPGIRPTAISRRLRHFFLPFIGEVDGG